MNPAPLSARFADLDRLDPLTVQSVLGALTAMVSDEQWRAALAAAALAERAEHAQA